MIYRKPFAKICLSGACLLLAYLVLLVNPNVLFAYSYEYRCFNIHADQPVPKQIEQVLDDVFLRISASELFTAQENFDIYICQDEWRFMLLTRNGQAGGVVNFLISPNVYIRPCSIKRNQIIPPETWKNSLKDRPLSYFIAHETVHAMQRYDDPFLIFHTPPEIVEGYAEYIGKSTTNQWEQLRSDYKLQTSNMKPESPLYDRYNLYITYLIEKQGYRYHQIVEEQPGLSDILDQVAQLE